MSAKLIITQKPDQRTGLPGELEAITPGAYFHEEIYQKNRKMKVVNLCKSYQYQSLGYYVSLLAEARGHKVMPEIATL